MSGSAEPALECYTSYALGTEHLPRCSYMATKGAPWSTLALFVLAGTDANLFALWLLRLLLIFPPPPPPLPAAASTATMMVLANANASLPRTIHVFCTQYRLLERTQGRPLATATQPFWTSSRFQLRTFWDYLSPLQATSIFISSTLEHKIDTISMGLHSNSGVSIREQCTRSKTKCK